MKLTILESTDTLNRLALEGSLDIAGSQEIENLFLALTAAGKKSTIIDFSGVTYLASFGLRLLIQGYKALDREGKKLVILRPQDEVRKVFEAAGLTDLLVITDDEATALTFVA